MRIKTERKFRKGVGATFATVLAMGLMACGDDDSTTSADAGTTTEEAASAETVDVNAIEYEFDLSATPTAETKTVNFTNDGKEPHVLVFAKLNEGFTVDEAIELQGEKGSVEDIGSVQSKPGQTSTIDVKKPLEPGDYVMLCPLGGADGPHYELGQLEEFSVE